MAKSTKQTLRFNAPAHHRFVLDDIEVAGGGEITVPAKVAEELLTAPYADFTVVDGDEADLVPSPEEELLAHTRDELNDIAAAEGVNSPGLLPNKDEVVKAILDARAQPQPEATGEGQPTTDQED